MTAVQIDPDTPVVSREAYESVFCGLTLAQARILNSVVYGLPVHVLGGRPKNPTTSQDNIYIFSSILLPGRRLESKYLFAAVGDLELIQARPVDETDVWLPRFGSSRIVSAHLITSFEILAGDRQWEHCETCNTVGLRTDKWYNTASISNTRRPGQTGDDLWPESWEWEQRVECPRCWFGY